MAVALVTVGPVLLAVLVDLDVAVVVGQVLGSGIVVGAGLHDQALVVAAAEHLLGEGFVALARLQGGDLAA
ncbi:hypothetical protein D3C80_1793780 [compost metagenome]